ncbi:hypothetical protein FRC08_014316 [Ceratobasidium sp. 394]|nr:hypothetical protein FRC08_014316 [Ceratobasidium sp. 394]
MRRTILESTTGGLATSPTPLIAEYSVLALIWTRSGPMRMPQGRAYDWLEWLWMLVLMRPVQNHSGNVLYAVRACFCKRPRRAQTHGERYKVLVIATLGTIRLPQPKCSIIEQATIPALENVVAPHVELFVSGLVGH